MSDEKWVTLTPEQVEALEQGVIVRARRGDTTVQGPLTSVWVGEFRRINADIEVREVDVPKPDPQRLVSVRHDDLTIALDAVESCVQADEVADRIRAALRGETS